jgi:site-specific DNA-methyltransferase (cytosine-N4-specific)
MSPRRNPHWDGLRSPQVAFSTSLGKSYQAKIEEFLESKYADEIEGKVQLILTSPPFPLASPKSYGNSVGQEYLEWISGLAKPLRRLLKPSGSIVLEIGNAWDKGSPTMSTLPLETLIAFGKAADLNVCQQFICNNPNRLPSPINYVNDERIRVKDSYTHVWWYGKKDRPYADNRSVLKEYSPAMKKLLERQSYNSGTRPSEHTIGKTSFLSDNGGAIPSNFLDIPENHNFLNWLEFAGSAVNRNYSQWCKDQGIKQHPAKMQAGLVEFFIRFLTKKNDLVVDPFGGSNTSGSIAEALGRRWVVTEPNPDYIEGSLGRFIRS